MMAITVGRTRTDESQLLATDVGNPGHSPGEPVAGPIALHWPAGGFLSYKFVPL